MKPNFLHRFFALLLIPAMLMPDVVKFPSSARMPAERNLFAAQALALGQTLADDPLDPGASVTVEKILGAEVLPPAAELVTSGREDDLHGNQSTQERVLAYIRQHSNRGFTAAVMAELLGLDSIAVRKILHDLAAQRQIYEWHRSRRTNLYSVSERPDNLHAWMSGNASDADEKTILEIIERHAEPISFTLLRFELNDFASSALDLSRLLGMLIRKGEILRSGLDPAYRYSAVQSELNRPAAGAKADQGNIPKTAIEQEVEITRGRWKLLDPDFGTTVTVSMEKAFYALPAAIALGLNRFRIIWDFDPLKPRPTEIMPDPIWKEIFDELWPAIFNGMSKHDSLLAIRFYSSGQRYILWMRALHIALTKEQETRIVSWITPFHGSLLVSRSENYVDTLEIRFGPEVVPSKTGPAPQTDAPAKPPRSRERTNKIPAKDSVKPVKVKPIWERPLPDFNQGTLIPLSEGRAGVFDASNSRIYCLRLDKGNVMKTIYLPDNSGSWTAADLTPDERTVAASASELYWSRLNPEGRAVEEHRIPWPWPSPAHSLTISDNGNVVAAVSHAEKPEPSLVIWDGHGAQFDFIQRGRSKIGLRMLANGRRVFTSASSGRVSAWEIPVMPRRIGQDRDLAPSNSFGPPASAGDGPPVLDFAINEARDILVTLTPQGLRVYPGPAASLKSEIKSIKLHSQDAMHMDVSPDGRRAVTSHEDGKVRVWDLERGREVTELHQPRPEMPSKFQDIAAFSGGYILALIKGRCIAWSLNDVSSHSPAGGGPTIASSTEEEKHRSSQTSVTAAELAGLLRPVRRSNFPGFKGSQPPVSGPAADLSLADKWNKLTDREKEYARRAAEGKTYKEIAAALQVYAPSVSEIFSSHIYPKLGFAGGGSNVRLVNRCLTLGVIDCRSTTDALRAWEKLSARLKEYAQMAAEGSTDKEIAGALKVSIKTVDATLNQYVYPKLGISGSSARVRLAHIAFAAKSLITSAGLSPQGFIGSSAPPADESKDLRAA